MAVSRSLSRHLTIFFKRKSIYPPFFTSFFFHLFSSAYFSLFMWIFFFILAILVFDLVILPHPLICFCLVIHPVIHLVMHLPIHMVICPVFHPILVWFTIQFSIHFTIQFSIWFFYFWVFPWIKIQMGLSYPVWHSSFINCFNGSLQCKFIWTLFYYLIPFSCYLLLFYIKNLPKTFMTGAHSYLSSKCPCAYKGFDIPFQPRSSKKQTFEYCHSLLFSEKSTWFW